MFRVRNPKGIAPGKYAYRLYVAWAPSMMSEKRSKVSSTAEPRLVVVGPEHFHQLIIS